MTTTILSGKGMYIWQLGLITGDHGKALKEGKDVKVKEQFEKFARRLQNTGIKYLLVKVADGGGWYNDEQYYAKNYVPLLCSVLREFKISPWGWHYIRHANPPLEASVALACIEQYRLDGLAIDAEAHVKDSGRSRASAYMNGLKKTNVPLALSSYRYPSKHPQIEWDVYANGCQIMMPQVYWQGTHSPYVGIQVEKSYTEYQTKWPAHEYVPTGAAYSERGWTATAEDLIEFHDACHNLGIKSVNYYRWEHADRYKLLDVIRDEKRFDADTPALPEEIPTDDNDIASELFVTIRSPEGYHYEGNIPLVYDKDPA